MKKVVLMPLLVAALVVSLAGLSHALSASDDPLVSAGTATGGAPVIRLVTESSGTSALLNFGQVTVYSAVSRPVQVQNLGGSDLSVTSISRYGSTSMEYTWSPDAPLTVAPGGSFIVDVTYAPVDGTTDVGYLAFASNDPFMPTAYLALSGSGSGAPAPIISLSTSTLSFLDVTVNDSSTKTVAVQNTGDADLNVTSISLCNGTSTEFTWSPDAPFTVAPGSSASLSVTYTPVDVSRDSGCLVIASNDPGRPTITLALAGNGIGAPAPIISLSTSTISFGQVTVNGSVSRTVSVQNTGSAVLNVTSIGRCTGTSMEYTWSPSAPFSVATGTGVPLTVTYSPVDVSTDAGCLEITSNDPVRPSITLALIGSGIIPQPQPIDIDISSLRVPGRVSLTRVKPIAPVLSVTNPGSLSSGTGNVTATLIGMLNSASVYNRTIALDNIAAGATGSFGFPTYIPTAIGTITWTVTIADGDPDSDVANATTKVTK